MKKYNCFISLVASLLFVAFVHPVQAQNRASAILSGLSSGIRSLGTYGVSFEVKSGDYLTTGYYTVGGDHYYMLLGDAEVYGGGGVRHEVNNAKKEVVIDTVDSTSRNILDNPVHGFDFLDSEFASELLWERQGQAAIRLTPKGGKSSLGVVTLTVDTAGQRPLSLAYDFDGERVTITVRSIAAVNTQPKTFDKETYDGYELIDFR